MQSNHLFPAVQTRPGSQSQGTLMQGQQPILASPSYPSTSVSYASVPQAHQVGQQFFSSSQPGSSDQPFPSVVPSSAQPFPSVLPSYPAFHQMPQPTHHSVQPIQQTPYVFGQSQDPNQKPLFPAMKERK